MSVLKKKSNLLALEQIFYFLSLKRLWSPVRLQLRAIGFLTESGAGIRWSLPSAWLWVDGHGGKVRANGGSAIFSRP